MDFKDLHSKKAIAFVTDETVNIGNLSKKLNYSESYFRMSYVHQGTWPEHWSVYSAFDLVVLMVPNYNAFNPLALNALKDYVKMGGSVLFAHHDGIMAAAGNDFEELLPVIPTGIRTVNHIPALDKFIKAKKPTVSENGMQFVESVSKEGSYTAATWGEFPLIVWKKYGMGMTAVVNISPTQDGFTNNKDEGFRLIWDYLIKNTVRPADMSMSRNDNARETVNMLNGLTIPGPEAILSYLLIYIALTIIIFIALAKMKKPGIAWIATIGLAFVMTGVIFKKAYSSNSDQKQRTAAVFSQRPMVSEAPAVKVYSIFSRANEKLDLNGTMLYDRFRKLPKVKVDYSAMGDRAAAAKTKIEQVITGKYVNDKASLSELNIQGLSARVFSVLSHSESIGMEPPLLKLDPAGLKIESSEFAGEIQSAEHIYLAGPSGLMIMEMKDNALVKSTKQAAFGTMDESLRKVIKGLPLLRPILFFAVKNVEEDDLLNDTYSVNGLNLYSVPVREKISGEIILPGEFNRIESTKSSMLVRRDGDWLTNRFMSSSEQTYDFFISVPLGYENMKTNEVIVDFGYTNTGGNILISPKISGKEGVKQKDGTFLFTDLPAGMIKNGQLKISLSVKAKVHLTDHLAAHQSNQWKVDHLKVSLKGKLEQSNAEF
jgi:hypothetical protein